MAVTLAGSLLAALIGPRIGLGLAYQCHLEICPLQKVHEIFKYEFVTELTFFLEKVFICHVGYNSSTNTCSRIS